MIYYRSAGFVFTFPHPIPELEAFETKPGTAEKAVPFVPYALHKEKLVSRTEGWVAEALRLVETWSAPEGLLMEVTGGRDFYIRSDGKEILWASQGQAGRILNETDRQILLGPVLVLALALRGTWSLHASAALFKENLIVFLGESGQGKSTLAASLANETNWRLVADDILPVSLGLGRVTAWPRFPQLKLPVQAQPGPGMPENLPINKVCVLMEAGLDEVPALQRQPAGQSVQAFLGHTAGTRLFSPELLAKHLAFCSLAAGQVPVYGLAYPRRREVLPKVKELLESLC
jgi:hypothetical protein